MPDKNIEHGTDVQCKDSGPACYARSKTTTDNAGDPGWSSTTTSEWSDGYIRIRKEQNHYHHYEGTQTQRR